MRTCFYKTCEVILAKYCKFARATRRDTQAIQSICSMLSVSTSLSRRGRSAKSKLEPGLPDKFIDRKPAKAKDKARKKKDSKPKLVKMKNLQVECFIDNAWHPATIKDGQTSNFLKGYEYTIVYDEDKYQETRVYDETMRIPA